MSDICWQPSAERSGQARVTAFAREAAEYYKRDLSTYDDLYDWSIAEPAEFWAAVWRHAEVIASRSADSVLSAACATEMMGARWFSGARLNYAENLLRRRDDATALIFRGESIGESIGETCERRELSFAELHRAVARLACSLREAGLVPGDRVAGFLPNLPETVIAMLATTSLGGVWSSCSPDFGRQGVLDRFGQIEAKILLTADGYVYGGKRHDSLAMAAELRDALPSVERLIVVPYLEREPDLGAVPSAVAWEDFLGPDTETEIDYAQLPFDHPLFIMYSSGTTGLPKCMVHSAGGTLLQHLKEHQLHCDLRRGDRLFYFTTCGWMMWNWLVSGLASGATLVLYDGSPARPPTALWDYAQEVGITHLGTSARYIAAVEKLGLKPARSHDLSALRTVLSTGSPLAPESYDYVYRDIKSDLQLSSISGGTDIISCFALGSPVLPVRRGELQCRGLGMAVEVWNEAGEAVTGEKGELVCTRPFPSMPTAFWNDADGARYRAAYFERWPGVWHHGDYAELRPEGGLVIYGRSDAVLNPGGVRIGTAEIYRIVEQCEEVLESIVVGQQWQDDMRVVLFVHLADGRALDDELRQGIRRRIRAQESPRHVPAKIIQVAAIPRTISGKVVELAVRNMIHGRPVTNRDALANPEALELYRDLPELEED